MNNKRFNILLLILCVGLSFGFSFIDFSTAKAQTNTNNTSPTPPELPPPPPPLPTVEDEVLIIETQVVNLNVRVVDRFNRPISNLKKSDFTIFEDREEQKIESFSMREVPTNYAMVIDNSGSLRFQLEKVIEASKTIIGTNRPDDETGIIRFVSSDKIEIVQDFTGNKEDLNDALDNLYIQGGQTAIIDAIYLAAERVDQYEKAQDPNAPKRRALILVSDGEDRSSFYKEEQLFKLLRESDVQIYAVGFIKELEDDGNFIRKSPQKKAKNFLTRLATETGGKAYFPETIGELDTIAKDIARELRTQYVLSYSPINVTQGFKNIKVVVKDGPKKEKRIAIAKTGRVQKETSGSKPTLQKNN
jgi:Ca-activated chloride channel family protein